MKFWKPIDIRQSVHFFGNGHVKDSLEIIFVTVDDVVGICITQMLIGTRMVTKEAKLIHKHFNIVPFADKSNVTVCFVNWYHDEFLL